VNDLISRTTRGLFRALMTDSTVGEVCLRARHAHLAVNAAFTWCQLMLDTLADLEAPWRKHTP